MTRFLVIGGAVVVVGTGAGIVMASSSGGDSNATASTPAASAPPSPAGGGTSTPAAQTTAPPTTAPASAPPPPSPVAISSGPCEASACSTSSPQATFAFSALGADSFECSLDGGAFAPCVSPHSVHAGPGAHEFRARVAGVDATTATFAWTVARDAVVNDTSTTNGITAHVSGHACGGPREEWTFDEEFRGTGVSATYHLHWKFPPEATVAPISGTADIPPINGVHVEVTIVEGLLTAHSSGGGVSATATARVAAKLAGSPQHPRLKFIQHQLTGTVSGGGAFSFGGGVLGFPVHLTRFAACP